MNDDGRVVTRGMLALVAGGAMVLAACGGGGAKNADTTSAASGAPPAAAPAAAAPAAGAAAAGAAGALPDPAPGAPPAGATAASLALGDSIFHGQAAGGLCFTCHGADGKGGPLAPPLVAPKKWLTGDGSYNFIVQRVTQGMPNQQAPYPGPMLPKGGAQLTDAQISAVAAYVYSISR